MPATLCIVVLSIANDESIVVGAFPSLAQALASCIDCRCTDMEVLPDPVAADTTDGKVLARGSINAGLAAGEVGHDEDADEASEDSDGERFEPRLLSGFYSTRGGNSDTLGVSIVEVPMGMFGFNYNND